MTYRTRIVIIIAFVCHLFLVPAWLTSQLQPTATAEQAPSSDLTADALPEPPPVQPGQKATEPVTIKADEQEKVGDIYKLRGNVEIDFRRYVLRADEITYNSTSGEIVATGHLVLDGGPHDEHITATNGTYNVNTDSGMFYNVIGSTGAKLRGKSVVLTSSNPFLFTGREVEKVGQDKIIVRSGRVTSCKLPHPKWTFNAGEVVVIAGENARLYHSTFHLFGVPIFYFPFVEQPVEKLARQSGFLLPHIGHSNIKGNTIGDGFYWAINRSMDATIGAEYFSRRGWSQRGDFRWRPTENSYLNASYFGVLDRGAPTVQYQYVPGVGTVALPAHQDQGGQDVRISAANDLPFGFHGVANVEYLSSYLFRAAFAERYDEAINSEVKSIAYASRARDGFNVNFMASRYQNFQTIEKGDVITIVHAPGSEISSVDKSIGNSPFHYSFDSALEALSRREPGFVTGNAVGRFDVTPAISLPLHWKGWDFRPQLDLHETYYTERKLVSPTNTIGTPTSDPINRRALETTFEITPPTLSRVFDKPVFNHKIKHTIEPMFRYRMVSGIDNFQNIVRFDYRDVLSDTNEIFYGFVTRLYAKRMAKADCETQPEKAVGTATASGAQGLTTPSGTAITVAPAARPGCEEQPVREIVSWEVAQKHFFDPTFGGALVPGVRNVFTTTEELTGIAFLTDPRNFSPIISRLRVNTGSRADADWQLDYDTQKGRISSSTEMVNYHFLKTFAFAAGHAFLQTPGDVLDTAATQPTSAVQQKFNQFRLQLNYGSPNRLGFNAGAVAGFDATQNYLQYSVWQTTYNWDCCGITFEYRRFNFGNIRDESQYRFALTLANVGTFGTLRKQERLF